MHWNEDTILTFCVILIVCFFTGSMVLDDAVEIDSKKNVRQEVGRILLKGDSITLMQEAQPVRPQETA